MVNNPQGDALSAFTTISASTASRMIMMNRTASIPVIPADRLISSFAIWPRDLPSRRSEQNRIVKSCTAPPSTTPITSHSVPGRKPNCAARSQAALMVSPWDSASTPKAAAPRAEIPPHTSIRFMGPKLRRALPMFNFEHRFEILTTQASWVLASRAASAVGAPATETRPDPLRLTETVQGRVAIVTGGATGLGRATAIECAQRGTAVAINYVELPERDRGAQPQRTDTANRAP